MMKVLLAEDSLTMRRLLALQLKGWDFEVTEAEDGLQAWDEFQKSSYSMVLTDWIMPGIDGLEFIRRIRAASEGEYVYIVLLTSRSENEDLVEAMDCGADDFLSKPCNPQELRVRLGAGRRILELEHTLIHKNLELMEAQAALVQSEKLAGIGQLAAGMAHEINNPIAFVSNNLAVLNRDIDALMRLVGQYSKSLTVLETADKDLADRLHAAEAECDLPWLKDNLPQLFRSSGEGLTRVREIISNLRDFAHLDEAAFDKMDVVAALEATLEVLTADFSAKGLNVTRQFDDHPCVHCQPAKMKQVFHSLVHNAIQASAQEGTVGIHVTEQNSRVTIEISDQGGGMDAVTQLRLFEPFYTTQPIGSGQGLGLSISYGIVKQHGGSIEFTTAPEKGTSFRVIVPMDHRLE